MISFFLTLLYLFCICLKSGGASCYRSTKVKISQRQIKKHGLLRFVCTQTCSQGHDDFLNVHIVPHSHDGKQFFQIVICFCCELLHIEIPYIDVGWLKTVEQYYYGSKYLMLL